MPNDDTPAPNFDNDTRRASVVDEAAQRRELQLLLLREGFTQDEAREANRRKLGAGCPDGGRHARARHAVPRAPDRPSRRSRSADVKSEREDAVMAEEEKEYFLNQGRLATMMAQSFSASELPTAVVQALLDVLEDNGIDRLEAMDDIIKRVEVMRTMHLHGVEG
jgi:hypothetical protein